MSRGAGMTAAPPPQADFRSQHTKSFLRAEAVSSMRRPSYRIETLAMSEQ